MRCSRLASSEFELIFFDDQHADVDQHHGYDADRDDDGSFDRVAAANLLEGLHFSQKIDSYGHNQIAVSAAPMATES